jgi:hypothetical protein
MITPTRDHDYHLRTAYGAWFTKALQPNVAITATLAQSISYEASHGKGWVRGDPISFEGEYRRFVKSLSKSLYGTTVYRRTGKRIPNCASVEGDGVVIAYHFHMALQRPSWISFADFKQAVLVTWFRSPWAKADILIEEITGDWAGYCFKKGPEVLMIA